MTADLEAVRAILVDAQRLGFLGPAPVDDQIAHALGLAALLDRAQLRPRRFLDLGSGGGLPGLVLVAHWPDVSAVLLDASQRRTAFLRRAVAQLSWTDAVSVWAGRGEVLGRTAEGRAAFPFVVARAFGSPAVTAEIGGSFVAPGGGLVVSEPPDHEDLERRWPLAGLESLGLSAPTFHAEASAGIVVLRRTTPLSERWPRADGIPAKRPLWKPEPRRTA